MTDDKYPRITYQGLDMRIVETSLEVYIVEQKVTDCMGSIGWTIAQSGAATTLDLICRDMTNLLELEEVIDAD